MATLSQLINALGDTIEELDDGPERDKLVQQQETLADQLDELIKKNVKADTPKYLQATADLESANKALVAAHQDVKKVAETITKIAQVIDVLAQLAANVK